MNLRPAWATLVRHPPHLKKDINNNKLWNLEVWTNISILRVFMVTLSGQENASKVLAL